MLDCANCLERVDEPLRREMGCGWLTRGDDEPVMPWRHSDDRGGHTFTTCPGYTTEIPEVADIAHAYAHWEKGQLRDALPEGQGASRALIDGLEILHGAVTRLVNRPIPKGGR